MTYLPVFDNFGESFKNVSEVIRAGLRLLENEESKVIALNTAIQPEAAWSRTGKSELKIYSANDTL